MSRIAVVGSRDNIDFDFVVRTLSESVNIFETDYIISGGARGADQAAEYFASMCGIPIKVIPPDWDKYGRSAGIIRNKRIVESCDELIAFWDGNSPGTKNAIETAKSMNKKVTIFHTKEV